MNVQSSLAEKNLFQDRCKRQDRVNTRELSFNFNPLSPSDAIREQKKKYFRGSFQFSIVTIYKLSPLSKREIKKFRHFSKLKISYFIGKKTLNFS